MSNTKLHDSFYKLISWLRTIDNGRVGISITDGLPVVVMTGYPMLDEEPTAPFIGPLTAEEEHLCGLVSEIGHGKLFLEKEQGQVRYVAPETYKQIRIADILETEVIKSLGVKNDKT